MKARKLKDKGYEFFLKKRYEKALHYFKEAVKLDPDDISLHQKIGDTLLRLDKKEEAVRAYKKAAEMYAKKGFLMKAIGIYKLILEIQPKAEDVKKLLVELYAEKGEEATETTSISSHTLLEKIKQRKEETTVEESSPTPEKEEKIKVNLDELEMEEKETSGEEEEEIEIELEGDEGDIDSFIKELGLNEEISVEIDEKGELISKLPAYPVFSKCSKNCFSEIVDSIELKRFARGEVIIKEGDTGKSFFVIVEGRVYVVKNTPEGPVKLATLGEGSFFGEFAFLTGERRSASVVAAEDVTVLEFSEDLLEDLLKKHPSIAEVLVEFYKERILDTMLAISPFFRVFDPRERREILKNFRFYEIPENTIVIKEGEKGDGFYIIMFGKVRVTRRDEEGKVNKVATLGAGDFFGEISLLTQGPTTATVTTIERTGLFKLPAEKFQEMIMTYPQVLELTYQYKEKREEELRQLFASKESLTQTGIV